MIPKLLLQSEQFKQQYKNSSDTSNNHNNNNNHHNNNGYANFYNDRSNTNERLGKEENDTLLQIQRRKLLRRAANRRSAQLSRARKKAHMEELKLDNRKLHIYQNLLESIPDLIICIDITGKITYLSDHTSCSIKVSTSADNGNNIDTTSDDEPTHINQILTPESVQIVLDTISQLAKAKDSDLQNNKKLGLVKEIYYHDATGFPVSGLMRCSKIISNQYEMENVIESLTESASEEPSIKKTRLKSPTGSRNNLNSLADIALAAAAAEEETKVEFMYVNSKNKLSKEDCSENYNYNQKNQEIGFICIIRPADTMLDNNTENLGTSSGLSKASMFAHDSNHRSLKNDDRPRSPSGSTNSNGSFSAHNDNSASSRQFSSGSASTSTNSRGDKNSTSSETGSDDNGNV